MLKYILEDAEVWSAEILEMTSDLKRIAMSEFKRPRRPYTSFADGGKTELQTKIMFF